MFFWGLLTLFVNSLAAYSLKEAQVGWQLTNAAFCDANSIIDWSCPNCIATGMNLVHTEVIEEQGTRAFVGYDTIGHYIIMSFRGSDNLINWLHNINMAKTPYPACKPCQVHTGFYQAYLKIQLRVQKAINDLRALYPTAPIKIFGHSLGGAEAVHAAADLHLNFKLEAVEVYTYGAPRNGDQAFADWYDGITSVDYRITHRRDVVPHMPPSSFGFWHARTEYFFPDEDNYGPLDYIVCDRTGEDPNCSNKYLTPTSTSDHLDYMDSDCCCRPKGLNVTKPEISAADLAGLFKSTPPEPKNPMADRCEAAATCGNCTDVTDWLGVPQCAWCEPQQHCHPTGSRANPCPDDRCVSKAPRSQCTNKICPSI